MDDLNPFDISSDAALVEVAPNTVESDRFKGTELRLVGYGDIGNNDPRKFFYVSGNFIHQLQWLAWVAAPTPITVDGILKRYAGFHKLKVVVDDPAPGHSGAVILCQSANGLVAVGLLFGGIGAGKEVWAFPILRAMKNLGYTV